MTKEEGGKGGGEGTRHIETDGGTRQGGCRGYRSEDVNKMV